MEAYRTLNPYCSVHMVFPMYSFKRLLKQLDFSLLRELLNCAGELTSIVKDVYDSKMQAKTKAKPETRTGKLEMIKKIINRASASAYSKPCDKVGKRNRQFVNSTESTSDEKSNRFSSPHSAKPSVQSVGKARCSPQVYFRHTVGKLSGSSGGSSTITEDMKKCINNYKTKCRFVDPNPVVIMESLLKDIMSILKKTKEKGIWMFHAAAKQKHFEEIEKQAAALRVFFCLYLIIIISLEKEFLRQACTVSS